MLTPSGSGTAAQPAHLPECSEIQQCAEESKQHHGDTDGVDVKAFGEMEGRGGQDNGAESDEKSDAVEGDEGAADTLKEGEKEAGPVEPLKTGDG